MRPGRRFGLSAEQKCDVWRRWKAGQHIFGIVSGNRDPKDRQVFGIDDFLEQNVPFVAFFYLISELFG